MARRIVLLGGDAGTLAAYRAASRSAGRARDEQVRVTVLSDGRRPSRLPRHARVLPGRALRVDAERHTVTWQPTGGGPACTLLYDELVVPPTTVPSRWGRLVAALSPAYAG